MSITNATLAFSNPLLEIEILGKGLKSPLEMNSYVGDFATVEGVDNVAQCIRDLIETRVGDRVMNEDYGTLPSDMLFESQEAIIDIVPFRIIEAIRRFEPRVANVTASATPFSVNDSHGVNILVQWYLRATGKQGNLVYPYYLDGESV